jgi:Family of unknown function (DUF6122)
MTWLALLHLGLHAAVPGGIALLFFRPNWKRAWLIMLSTMMVDLDHLLADPIYDPARCGIGFHPLHTYPAIAAYAVLLVPRVTRLMALGLVIHMALDALDCVWKSHDHPQFDAVDPSRPAESISDQEAQMAKKRKRKGRIKSRAQRRKFAELLVQGKIKPEVYERRESGAARDGRDL